MRQRDKVLLLNYIKEMLKCRIDNKTLNERCLYLMKQEILQATYAYLLQVGIQATRLFYDETSQAFSTRRHSRRWIYCAGRITARTLLCLSGGDYENKHADRAYQRLHPRTLPREYRTQRFCEVFFLAPEYLAKLYHRKRGSI